MIDLKQELLDRLVLDDPGLVGCRRRGVWNEDQDISYRWFRGNALLGVVGVPASMNTPAGWLQYYEYDSTTLVILQFRGGKWNPDWTVEFYDLWSLVHEYSGAKPEPYIMVLHEYRGDLDVKKIDIPEALNPQVRVEKILAEFTSEPPGRIPKSGPRAARICPHCPFKQRCDATDTLRGETNDYSPTYPMP